jgi:hypothetical protein
MRITLEKFGGRVAIGSSSRICISGDGVMPLHAEIKARSSGGTSVAELRPVGDVWVTRGSMRRLLTPNDVWVLADNDRFEIADHTFIYYNLDSCVGDSNIDADIRRATAWLTQ